ncbi:HAD family phosphatase [Haloarcula sp. JP-L23]|uniref:HAD family hydrolase n=1 Tax=Haloarcula sp. JP-L23 TaxID=2716717 RepID=UPI00140F081A|nr:HAD-IB family phosphatase [Haloarcula sp. JP-L23]
MERLVVFDLDGTLTRQRGGFDLLHTLYGTTPAGDALMDRLEADQLSFEEWCRATVERWRTSGITESDIDRATRAVKPKAGAPELLARLHRENVAFGILSAGIANLATQFQQYDPDFVRGNWLQFEDGKLSGIEVGVGPDQKGAILRRIRDTRSHTDITYVGDSHTDTEAFVEADTAVLFDPDDRVPDTAVDAADTVVESTNLGDVMPIMMID